MTPARRSFFRKSERLRSAGEFRSLLREGRNLREGGIALYYAERNFGSRSRLGIIVSRRVFRNAARRNRAKRVVREFFRLRKNDFRSNYDMVVKFIESSNSLAVNNLRQALAHLFKRAGVLGADA